MKIDNDTIEILKNFSLINSQIYVKKGNIIRSMERSKTILAESKLPFTFDVDFAIYDLNKFMLALNLFKEPELTFNEKCVIISDNNKSLNYYYANVETFDDNTLLWTWTGSGEVVTGALSGKYAAPYNSSIMSAADGTHYITVPDPDGASSGYYNANLGSTYDYFGLFWGSVDTYNTLEFFNDDELVAVYSGADISNPNPANGNQEAPSTNLYVNFFDLPAFNKFTMTSTNFAFEADNIAVGNAPAITGDSVSTPEPTTMLLFGSGLIGLAGFGRKFKKS